MNTIQESHAELSNTCFCQFCEPCGIITEAEFCEECHKATVQQDCYGSCYEDGVGFISEFVADWTKSVGNPEEVRISSKAMNWNRVEGYTIAEATGEAIIKAMSLNGEWNLRFKITGLEFKIMRYSHDEPTGSSFIVTPN